MLTTEQLSVLRSAMDAETDPEFVAYRTNGQTPLMAEWYNADTSPAHIVWKTNVHKNEVGKAFVASALAAITAGNNDKLSNFAQWNETVNPSRADQRAFFDDVFSVSAGATTRAALAALWKRPATRVEKLFATGTGTDASPATLVFEGRIADYEISAALAL
jgi:hypothetical protein